MPDETPVTNAAPPEGEVKPTITIAEKQAAPASDVTPTITIAEKQPGE